MQCPHRGGIKGRAATTGYHSRHPGLLQADSFLEYRAGTERPDGRPRRDGYWNSEFHWHLGEAPLPHLGTRNSARIFRSKNLVKAATE